MSLLSVSNASRLCGVSLQARKLSLEASSIATSVAHRLIFLARRPRRSGWERNLSWRAATIMYLTQNIRRRLRSAHARPSKPRVLPSRADKVQQLTFFVFSLNVLQICHASLRKPARVALSYQICFHSSTSNLSIGDAIGMISAIS